jgi:peptidoglycan glycosyltransferase
MEFPSTRRTFVTGMAAAGATASLPWKSRATSWDHLTGRLMEVCRQEFRQVRGGLAMTSVFAEGFGYVSDFERCAQTLWKPGSTVKPFLLLHLFERGLLREQEAHPCPGGPLPFAGRRLDCSHAPQGGPLDPAMALALSCNRCFLHWAERLTSDPKGIGAFAETLRRAGFAARQAMGSDCGPAEVRTPVTPEAAMLQAIGEADVLTTPLALLEAYQRLLMRLHQPDAPRGSRVLLDGMRDCVRAGTGVDARVPGVDLAGKTGTATSASRQSLNGWMLSYWPSRMPRFAMVVFVEQARGGVEAAAITKAAWQSLQTRPGPMR